MKAIGALGGLGRIFGPGQLKLVSPDAEGEGAKGRLDGIRQDAAGSAMRLAKARAAEAEGGEKPRPPPGDSDAIDRQAEPRRKNAFRIWVAQAVVIFDIGIKVRVLMVLFSSTLGNILWALLFARMALPYVWAWKRKRAAAEDAPEE